MAADEFEVTFGFDIFVFAFRVVDVPRLVADPHTIDDEVGIHGERIIQMAISADDTGYGRENEITQTNTRQCVTHSSTTSPLFAENSSPTYSARFP